MVLLHPKIRIHHQFLIFIQLHLQVSVHQSSQGAQETPQISKELLRLQPDHNNQSAWHHFGRRVSRTVQTIPATSLCVAARVTDAVTIVVCTVSFISKITQEVQKYGYIVIWQFTIIVPTMTKKLMLANDILACGWVLALKAIKEAPRGVTLLITKSILKEMPAGNASCAVYPWLLPIQWAVSSIPLTFMVVTLVITNLIPWMLFTLHIGADRSSEVFFTVSSREVNGTVTTVLVWVGRVSDAGSSILTGPRAPLFILTVWTTEAWLALAVQVANCGFYTAPSVLAM